MSFFEPLDLLPEDPILGIPFLYAADIRIKKADLSVGAYNNARGETVVMSSVKKAEDLLLKQNLKKDYLPIGGHPEYVKEMLQLIFGKNCQKLNSGEIFAVQSIGGTGALRIGGEFLVRKNLNNLFLSNPSWGNHHTIFNSAGMKVQTYPYYSQDLHAIDFPAMCAGLQNLPQNSIILLHACCHNPTGADPTQEQWKELSEIIKKQRLIPFFDLAYQGLGKDLESDAFAIRYFVEQGHELLVASSNSKNFGLYGERIGTLAVVSKNEEIGRKVLSQFKQIIRSVYSVPPLQGARIINTILKSSELTTEWQQELSSMSIRIKQMRLVLIAALQKHGLEQDFNFLNDQIGLFSYTGLSKDQVAKLRQEHGIYMIGNGRMNMAGLNYDNVDYVAESIAAVLKS